MTGYEKTKRRLEGMKARHENWEKHQKRLMEQDDKDRQFMKELDRDFKVIRYTILGIIIYAVIMDLMLHVSIYRTSITAFKVSIIVHALAIISALIVFTYRRWLRKDKSRSV